ncbi:MAG TPA: AMP-binding protein [Candidatus Sulfotelmatobacter sp.]|nr:AMP-binding protein [Candidatus Sulfotelmatobacter sp.]
MLHFANLIEALASAPAENPFITFWVDEDTQDTVSFGEFRERARARAGLLYKEGVRPADRLIVIMPQSISAMEVFVGGMMLGAVPAFLAYPNTKVEPSKYRSGLEGVTANLQAKAVVLDEDFPGEMLEHLDLRGGTRLYRAGHVERWAAIDEVRQPEIKSSDFAFIQHSAGTTGLQKGVALTHDAVLRQIGHLQQALKIDRASDRIYSWLPLYHDMGLIACFMLPMVCHLSVVMQSPTDWVMSPETMLQAISSHRCTLAWLPNFAFQFVPRRTRLDRFDSEPDLSSLRALINCSEPVRAKSIGEFSDAFARLGLNSQALQSSYAMAEDVFAITQSCLDVGPARIWADRREFQSARRIVQVAEEAPDGLCFISSGHLLPNHKIRIVDDSLNDLRSGNVGEILVQSDCLFSGYYNRPDLTSQVFVEGWYRTGDLGFFIDGELFVVGRQKDLIIVAGENLYPQDIEEIIASHPAVHDGRVVATGSYNPQTGTEDVIVVAELESERYLGDTAIEQELRNLVVKGMGVAVGMIYLKPPKWIVKSTAGKPARSATLEKLLREHPELAREG